jgi:diguanylate cyclase (GGDEF)-like protein
MTRRQQAIAVLFLDLDEFKPINDNFGHDAGDRLLMAVGHRLQSCLRPEDTIARLGGDEFTVLLEDITDVRYATGVAERITDALQEPFQLDGHEETVTASIGIAVGNGREATTEELVRNADIAMYEAKRRGKARYVVFNEALSRNGRDAFRTEAEPATAFEHAEVIEGEPNGAPREDAPPPEPAPEIAEGRGVEPVEDTAVGEAPPTDTAPSGQDERAPGGGSSLSEARRRRRMRFPPR